MMSNPTQVESAQPGRVATAKSSMRRYGINNLASAAFHYTLAGRAERRGKTHRASFHRMTGDVAMAEATAKVIAQYFEPKATHPIARRAIEFLSR